MREYSVTRANAQWSIVRVTQFEIVDGLKIPVYAIELLSRSVAKGFSRANTELDVIFG